MTWLVYASSSPVDTINRMATGRWSVRPDSWVMKLNSSTSWVWGKRSILIRPKGHHAEVRVGSGLGWRVFLRAERWEGPQGPKGLLDWPVSLAEESSVLSRGTGLRVPYLWAWSGRPTPDSQPSSLGTALPLHTACSRGACRCPSAHPCVPSGTPPSSCWWGRRGTPGAPPHSPRPCSCKQEAG